MTFKDLYRNWEFGDLHFGGDKTEAWRDGIICRELISMLMED